MSQNTKDCDLSGAGNRALDALLTQMAMSQFTQPDVAHELRMLREEISKLKEIISPPSAVIITGPEVRKYLDQLECTCMSQTFTLKGQTKLRNNTFVFPGS